MLRPKIPTNPAPTGLVAPPVVVEQAPVEPHPGHAPSHCHCLTQAPVSAAPRSAVQLTPTGVVALVGAGTAVVLVVGAVLVSLLLAVSITAGSLAITALVARSILNQERKH